MVSPSHPGAGVRPRARRLLRRDNSIFGAELGPPRRTCTIRTAAGDCPRNPQAAPDWQRFSDSAAFTDKAASAQSAQFIL